MSSKLEEQDLSTFNDYYWEVARQASDLGFSAIVLRAFHYDILRAFEDGLSVEDAVQEIF